MKKFFLGLAFVALAGLTINGGGVSVNGGVPFTRIVVQTFTANGTYTPTAGMLYATGYCLCAGGSGGGVAGDATLAIVASGGGAGSASTVLLTAASVGASQPITIGTGGVAPSAGKNTGNAGTDTSIGSLCVGKGGSGGTGAAAGPDIGVGGAGGVAGTGTVTAPGQNGTGGAVVTATASAILAGGAGGDTEYGSGGRAAPGCSTGAGAATGYGTGSAGAACYASATNITSTDGQPGLAIIMEYVR